MRKSKMSVIGAFLAVAATIFVSSGQVYAADTYTVTFRPGNVGYFSTEANQEGDRKAMATAVAAQEYSGYTYEVTAKGAIKVTVLAGEAVPSAPTYIQADAGYFAKSASVWGPAGEKCDRNVDYVVDYGKLVDGVEYTVKYVDSSSGESIAPVYIAQANIGETIKVTAPKTIEVGAATYKRDSKATVELKLNADASKNVITHSYTAETDEDNTEPENSGSVQNPVNPTTPSPVTQNPTTVNQTVQNPANAAGGNANAANAAGGNANTANANAAGENANAADANANDLTVIEDEETPLADAPKGQNNDGETEETVTAKKAGTVEIEDEDVPLSDAGSSMDNVAVVGAVLFGIAAVSVAGVWFYRKKKLIK